MNTTCDSCKRIDFGRLLEVPAMELVPMFDRSLPYPIGSSEDFPLADEGSIRIWDPEAAKCPLCSLLRLSSGLQFEVAALPSFKRIDPNGFSLKSTSFTMGCGWSRGAADWANDCHKLVVVHANSRKTWHLKEKRTGFAVCLPKEREEAPLVPRVIPDKFDTRKARSWVRSCRKEHGYSCNATLLPVPGMRLIDCESRFIVDAEPKMLWVALSYVWGTTQSGTLSEGASKTVEDAIRVTKDLGYRYLWIDQFCIDQDDEIHKSSQIARMDAIYRGADLTIIAAAGQDSNYGLPGIGTSRRKEQQFVELDTCTILWTGPSPIEETMISTWCTRGWTFQEGLFSRRRLYFTDRQSWFECSDACWMEGMGGPRSESLSDDIHATAGRPLALFRDLMIDQEDAVYHESTVGLRIFLKFVTVYTQRSLKFDSDILAAFSGAANYLQSTGPRVSHILGLPYLGSMLDTESAENFMAYALCWVHDCETRRIPQFPSWTWAGWAGAVSWPHYSSTSEKNSGEIH